jgi:hypothetical protein
MKINVRGLNPQERYACDVGDIKKVFSAEDEIHISFGALGRNYEFDNAFIKRPKIEGLILSSMQINRREKITDSHPMLSFYVIDDGKYSDRHGRIFAESILPEMLEWFRLTLAKPVSAIPGVEEFLVEWTGSGFKTHRCRFA